MLISFINRVQKKKVEGRQNEYFSHFIAVKMFLNELTCHKLCNCSLLGNKGVRSAKMLDTAL